MKKIIALLLALAMVFSLAACTSSNEPAPAEEPTPSEEPATSDAFVLNACIASEPETIDVSTISSVDGSTYVQHMFENLMKYQQTSEHPADDPNMFMTEVVPGQAASYTVSDDEMVYTFTLRDDIFWSDGQPVTANDWVYSWRRLVNPATAADYGYFLDGIVLNAAAIQAEEKAPEELGIKAIDDKTLEITLEAPCSYFMTMLTYNIFAPMSRTFFESKGGKFGDEYDPKADTYLYGTSPENIAYCGPYLVANATEKNTIVFKANDSYWNKDNINIKTINWFYNDGSDATKAYKDACAHTIVSATLNASALELAKGDGNFEKYGFTSMTDATAFMGFLNMNRAAYANVADTTTAVSEFSDSDKVRTNIAMRNVHFRRAICFGLDRGAYNAQEAGEDLKFTSLINSYTPGTLVKLPEDVTVSINGEDKTFKAGTFYGEIMQAQIDADGVKIKVWDPNGDGGIGASSGYDGWYNPTEAVAELDKAIEELEKEGVTIDAENPIKVDLPYLASNEVYTNKANSLKQSIEASLGGKVQVVLVACDDPDSWYNAGYYTDSGKEANYSIYDLSGWGPDYGDPSTYLDTFLPDYAGYMIKCIGIY